MSLGTLKIAMFVCLGVGSLLSIFSAFIPGLETNNLESTAQENSIMTPENQAKWDSVPGTYSY